MNHPGPGNAQSYILTIISSEREISPRISAHFIGDFQTMVRPPASGYLLKYRFMVLAAKLLDQNIRKPEYPDLYFNKLCCLCDFL